MGGAVHLSTVATLTIESVVRLTDPTLHSVVIYHRQIKSFDYTGVRSSLDQDDDGIQTSVLNMQDRICELTLFTGCTDNPSVILPVTPDHGGLDGCFGGLSDELSYYSTIMCRIDGILNPPTYVLINLTASQCC